VLQGVAGCREFTMHAPSKMVLAALGGAHLSLPAHIASDESEAIRSSQWCRFGDFVYVCVCVWCVCGYLSVYLGLCRRV